jgi:hypothetical protein
MQGWSKAVEPKPVRMTARFRTAVTVRGACGAGTGRVRETFMLMSAATSQLVLIDYQARLLPAITQAAAVAANAS